MVHIKKKKMGGAGRNYKCFTQLDADPGQPLFWVFLAMLGAPACAAIKDPWGETRKDNK